MSKYWKLVDKALYEKGSEFAKKLENPKTRRGALEDFGLEGDDLDRVLAALNKVDFEAIKAFQKEIDTVEVDGKQFAPPRIPI